MFREEFSLTVCPTYQAYLGTYCTSTWYTQAGQGRTWDRAMITEDQAWILDGDRQPGQPGHLMVWQSGSLAGLVVWQSGSPGTAPPCLAMCARPSVPACVATHRRKRQKEKGPRAQAGSGTWHFGTLAVGQLGTWALAQSQTALNQTKPNQTRPGPGPGPGPDERRDRPRPHTVRGESRVRPAYLVVAMGDWSSPLLPPAVGNNRA